MKEYNIKYRANHFLYMVSAMALIIICIGSAIFIIANLNLTPVAEGGDPKFNSIVCLGVLICAAVILTILLTSVIPRVGNKNASIELNDTSIKINLPNKSFDKNFDDIEKIEYIAGGMVVSGGSIRPSSKYMLIIYPIEGKKFKLRAPGGIKEYRAFHLFYEDFAGRIGEH